MASPAVCGPVSKVGLLGATGAGLGSLSNDCCWGGGGGGVAGRACACCCGWGAGAGGAACGGADGGVAGSGGPAFFIASKCCRVLRSRVGLVVCACRFLSE